MPTPLELLTNFASAASVPIVKPIVWPDTIPVDHPVRQLSLCVRFWSVAVAAHLTEIISKGEKGWVEKIFWHVICATTCNQSGEPIFTAHWPEVWQKHLLLPVEHRQAYVPVYSDTGHLVPPPPDYYILGDWLKSQYDNEQGKVIMYPLWEAALSYNGWKTGEGKNSEVTTTSVPSGEKPPVVASV